MGLLDAILLACKSIKEESEDAISYKIENFMSNDSCCDCADIPEDLGDELLDDIDDSDIDIDI